MVARNSSENVFENSRKWDEHSLRLRGMEKNIDRLVTRLRDLQLTVKLALNSPTVGKKYPQTCAGDREVNFRVVKSSVSSIHGTGSKRIEVKRSCQVKISKDLCYGDVNIHKGVQEALGIKPEPAKIKVQEPASKIGSSSDTLEKIIVADIKDIPIKTRENRKKGWLSAQPKELKKIADKRGLASKVLPKSPPPAAHPKEGPSNNTSSLVKDPEVDMVKPAREYSLGKPSKWHCECSKLCVSSRKKCEACFKHPKSGTVTSAYDGVKPGKRKANSPFVKRKTDYKSPTHKETGPARLKIPFRLTVKTPLKTLTHSSSHKAFAKSNSNKSKATSSILIKKIAPNTSFSIIKKAVPTISTLPTKPALNIKPNYRIPTFSSNLKTIDQKNQKNYKGKSSIKRALPFSVKLSAANKKCSLQVSFPSTKQKKRESSQDA